MRRRLTKAERLRRAEYRRPRVVYALACPTCGVIRYVGHSVNSPEGRLLGHLRNPLNADMRDWFRDLRSRGMRPVAIELSSGRTYGEATRMEKQWIALCSVVYGRSLFNRIHRGDYIAVSVVSRTASRAAIAQRAIDRKAALRSRAKAAWARRRARACAA